MDNAGRSAVLPYVDKVNGDSGVRGVLFDTDRCAGERSEVPVTSTPAVGAIFGVTMAAAIWTGLMGGRYR